MQVHDNYSSTRHRISALQRLASHTPSTLLPAFTQHFPVHHSSSGIAKIGGYFLMRSNTTQSSNRPSSPALAFAAYGRANSTDCGETTISEALAALEAEAIGRGGQSTRLDLVIRQAIPRRFYRLAEERQQLESLVVKQNPACERASRVAIGQSHFKPRTVAGWSSSNGHHMELYASLHHRLEDL